MYRLFSWEHSYFSGKVRAYLRYKQHQGGLGAGFEDVLATRDLIQGLLLPATGTGAVPQLQTPDGRLVQDSSEIIDFCEDLHPKPPVIPDPAAAPKQCLASYLIELLADEWMVVYGFWERWHYSLQDVTPNHLEFNAQQWGAMLEPEASGLARRQAGHSFFENVFGISVARSEPRAVYAGLVHLGVTPETEPAWEASNERILGLLEAHFSDHDFVLGGRPSLGDFGLMGPLYAHLFRDAASGFALQTRHPLVAEWVERCNGTNALNARTYGQRLYSLGEDGQLVGRPANSDGAEWLAKDELPASLEALLAVFFEEMWPVLVSTLDVLTDFIESDAHAVGSELPGKTFFADPGFGEAQVGEGPLSHEFVIGGVRGRRMLVPYQVWMLQRIEAALARCTASGDGRRQIESLLERFPRGPELLELSERLAGCRLRKEGGRLFSVPAS
jgi:glutathione S-transferase